MKTHLVAVFVFVLTVVQAGYTQVLPGLQVKNGCFYREGKPYRGVGANYFDLFRRVMNNPTNTTSLAGLERLAQAGIPFVRFAGPYSAQEWRLYLENKEEYFRRFDLVVRRAEQVKIGLIPSLFWTLTLCETVNEPRDQWGNPQSKTLALMRQYVSDVVRRYKHSPALWAYEFGNEVNLSADLPNAAQFRPKNGTERDDINAKHLVTGAPVTMQKWIQRVPAIVQMFYAGEKGGLAIADVLFGDYNPGGKLPMTFPKTIGQVPINYSVAPWGHSDRYWDDDGSGIKK